MQFQYAGRQGADVSFYQDSDTTPQQIDFSKMVEQGASYVVVRAGQGRGIDPDFQYNWRKAREAGLPRGSYWFFDSRVDPEEQAVAFAALFINDKPELDLWLDIEEHYGGAYGGWVNWKKFLNKLRERLPDVKIGIYTNYYYITGRIPSSEYAYFAQFVLWLAWYTYEMDDVLVPRPWTEVLYWQWGTPPWGIAWGCESEEIDMNFFNGTKAEFSQRYNLNLGDVPVNYEATNIYSDMALRPDHNTNNTAIKRFPTSSKWIGDLLWTTDVDIYATINGVKTLTNRAGDMWLRVLSVNGVPESGWVAITHLAKIYCTYKEIPLPTTGHVVEVFIDGVLEFRKELP